jgi:hypothetical protein
MDGSVGAFVRVLAGNPPSPIIWNPCSSSTASGALRRASSINTTDAPTMTARLRKMIMPGLEQDVFHFAI